jgi:UDP-glucose 4-epimerase
MKILFTGGSSFTGYWFIRELARAGHDVVATFRKKAEEYPDAVRQQRVKLATGKCRPVFGVSFGDDAFLKLIREQKSFDLLCHHAADVTNYKSADFDVPTALANNTKNLSATLAALRDGGCKAIVLTGSVFENDEGAGSEGLPAFSPYGLSKALTYQMFRYHAPRNQLKLGKFVIPNPFGPHEEPRFTSYLVKNWFARATPAVSTPSYVRDNIHVSLLAKVYAKFAGEVSGGANFSKINPSGYAESQGAFTQRFAAEMKQRLGLPCDFELKRQTDFSEPRVRINTEWADALALGWDESQAWDELAEYYRTQFKPA